MTGDCTVGVPGPVRPSSGSLFEASHRPAGGKSRTHGAVMEDVFILSVKPGSNKRSLIHEHKANFSIYINTVT